MLAGCKFQQLHWNALIPLFKSAQRRTVEQGRRDCIPTSTHEGNALFVLPSLMTAAGIQNTNKKPHPF